VVSRARALALATLAAALASCGPVGTTCGRGRCNSGEMCISIFGPGRQNQGWNDPTYPNVTNEWWCVRDCPGGKTCSGQCLEDPADSNVVVCAVDHVDVEYFSAGTACLCDPTSNLCYQDQPVSGFEIIDQCQPTHTVLQMCLPNMPCQAGTLAAGATVPAVREFYMDNGYEHVYCPGYPNNTFGPLLPEGKKVRIYADTDHCP
jgi:hypothetical protein